jgi:CubicO group peptidase (beta-lactamase class C family)
VPELSSWLPELQAVVDAAREKFYVPGVAVGVLDGDDVISVASGVTNVRTQVPMTTDTVFLIGSITKVWTTTLIMGLVDEGLLDLDVPARTYLPELKLADETVAATVTLRHLLAHTSGITGDHFIDFGRGDEAVARYVAEAAKFTQLHAMGELFSYCNSGFIIAGRLVEVLLGKPFHQILRERIIEPLGLKQTVQHPEDAMLHRTSVGHLVTAESTIDIWPTWMYPRSMDPAGTSLCSTVEELLAFGRLHLAQGQTPSGNQLLSPSSVKQMQQPQIEIPYVGYGSLGLGWMLLDGYGQPCFGHGGGSPGGLDWLYVLPERNFAMSFYANLDPSGAGPAFGKEVQRFVFEKIAGVSMPPTPEYGAPPVDLTPYAGTYEHADAVHEVTAQETQLHLVASGQGHIAPFEPYRTPAIPLRPLDAETFTVDHEDADGVGRFRFLKPDASGRPTIMHTGLRAFRRTS